MSELSLVRRGASGPKVQVLYVQHSNADAKITVSGVTINPTRVFAIINGQLGSIYPGGYSLTFNSERANKCMRCNSTATSLGESYGPFSMSNGTLTINATDVDGYYFQAGTWYYIAYKK